MPGFLPSLELATATAGDLSISLDELPVAALIRSLHDLRCIACNRRLLELLGSDDNRNLDDAMLESPDPQALAWREVVLRGADESAIAATMLSLPVLHEGQSSWLCIFLEHEPHGWRNVDLVGAIDEVIRDDMRWFSGAVMERLARRRSPAATGPGLRQLTPREREILKLVCEGRNDAHIASELAISRNTLRNHLANIYGKADVKRRSEAVVWGRERGLGES